MGQGAEHHGEPGRHGGADQPVPVQGVPVRQRDGAVLPEEPVLQPGVGPVHLRGRRAWQDGRTARS